jgi:hypothetical protein
MKTGLFKPYGKIPDAFMDPAEVAKLIVGLAASPPELAPTDLTIMRQRR